jgi:hypothetical protein
MPKVIHIAGKQRSGTSWIGALLDDNFKAEVRNGPKHLHPDRVKDAELADVDVVVLIEKRVEDWIWSIRKIGMQKGPEWHKEFYDAWKARPGITLEHVWYHDVLGDWVGWLEHMEKKYGLERRMANWRNNKGDAGWDERKRERYLAGTQWEVAGG